MVCLRKWGDYGSKFGNGAHLVPRIDASSTWPIHITGQVVPFAFPAC